MAAPKKSKTKRKTGDRSTNVVPRSPGAPRGNQNAVGNEGGDGRLPKYHPDFHLAVAKKLYELGATDSDLAEAFGVSIPTLWDWQAEHTELFEACKIGKDIADGKVKRSLFQRATGYTYRAVKIMKHKGEPIVVPYNKHVPPNVNAGKFWLINRCPDEFKPISKLKQDVDREDPLATLRKQLEGTALRPKEG
jgi:hypothetical protein